MRHNIGHSNMHNASMYVGQNTGGTGGTMEVILAHPFFGRSVNPFSTRGQIVPTKLLLAPLNFGPSAVPAVLLIHTVIYKLSNAIFDRWLHPCNCIVVF